MASTMASTLALSRPSEKLGTHSTKVLGIREKDKGMRRVPATQAGFGGVGFLCNLCAPLAIFAVKKPLTAKFAKFPHRSQSNPVGFDIVWDGQANCTIMAR